MNKFYQLFYSTFDSRCAVLRSMVKQIENSADKSLLFAGIDVGKDYLCIVTREISAHDSVIVNHEIAEGSITESKVWQYARNIIPANACVAIDVGYMPGIVRLMSRPDWKRCKGSGSAQESIIIMSSNNVNYIVDTNRVKRSFWNAVFSGFIQINSSNDIYIEHMASEKPELKNGRVVFKREHDTDNHFFDAECLIVAAQFIYGYKTTAFF